MKQTEKIYDENYQRTETNGKEKDDEQRLCTTIVSCKQCNILTSLVKEKNGDNRAGMMIWRVCLRKSFPASKVNMSKMSANAYQMRFLQASL